MKVDSLVLQTVWQLVAPIAAILVAVYILVVLSCMMFLNRGRKHVYTYKGRTKTPYDPK